MRLVVSLQTLVALALIGSDSVAGFSVTNGNKAHLSSCSSSSLSSFGLPTSATTSRSSCRLSSSSDALATTDSDSNNEEQVEIKEPVEQEPRNFDFYQTELERLARTTSKDPTAVETATALYAEMFAAPVAQTVWPTTYIYTLLCEIHAYSNDPNGAETAQDILMCMLDPATQRVPGPNLVTYGNVMEAFAKRKQPERAKQVVDEILAKDEEMTADAYIYNRLIRAYGMAGQADSALQVLQEMLEAFEQDEKSVMKPNYKTWLSTMRAFAPPSQQQSQDANAVETIQTLLEEMKEGFDAGQADWEPGTDIYNALLRAMSYQKGSAAKEAEGILYDMIAQFRAGAEHMRPNAESFYNVVQAYRRVSDPGVAFKVEKLLELQEALRDGKDKSLDPTARTYTAAMAAMSRDRDPKKSVKAKRLLDLMKEQFAAGDASFEPRMGAYRSLLNACAYTKGEPEDNLAAFQIAVDTLKELRESESVEPDVVIYSLFLKACGNLMPPTRKRDAVIENVFLKCCKDGLMSESVLAEFENGASDELQLKLLGGFLADGVQPPEEWSRNVIEQ